MGGSSTDAVDAADAADAAAGASGSAAAASAPGSCIPPPPTPRQCSEAAPVLCERGRRRYVGTWGVELGRMHCAECERAAYAA